MAMNNLGRVAMVHRGDYDPAYEYKPLDCCYHEGSTYFCKAPTTGNAPPSTVYWVLLSTSASTVDRQAAEAAAQAAAGSATAAANQVTLAADEVALAQGYANTASTQATAAAGSASAAADSAGQALASAGNAEISAGAAASSATSAANSATAAATSAASVDGPGLYNAIATHDHSGSTGMGVRIDYEHLQGSPPCPYEVGDILTTINTASPAVRWPGTVWAQLPPGTFLTAAGEGYAVGSTGGTAENVLSANQNGPHQHTITVDTTAGAAGLSSGAGYLKALTSDIGRIGTTIATDPITISGAINVSGTGAPIENRPPYYATNIWRRTA